jgi:hypothetical protein
MNELVRQLDGILSLIPYLNQALNHIKESPPSATPGCSLSLAPAPIRCRVGNTIAHEPSALVSSISDAGVPTCTHPHRACRERGLPARLPWVPISRRSLAQLGYPPAYTRPAR